MSYWLIYLVDHRHTNHGRSLTVMSSDILKIFYMSMYKIFCHLPVDVPIAGAATRVSILHHFRPRKYQ